MQPSVFWPKKRTKDFDRSKKLKLSGPLKQQPKQRGLNRSVCKEKRKKLNVSDLKPKPRLRRKD